MTTVERRDEEEAGRGRRRRRLRVIAISLITVLGAAGVVLGSLVASRSCREEAVIRPTTPTEWIDRFEQLAAELNEEPRHLGSLLDRAARELSPAGTMLVPRLLHALRHERGAGLLLAAAVLGEVRTPEVAPTILELLRTSFAPPSRPDWCRSRGECAIDLRRLEGRLRLLRALGATGDPRGLPYLVQVFSDDRALDEERLGAIAGLVAFGTPEALAVVDEYRDSRPRRTAPWFPPVLAAAERSRAEPVSPSPGPSDIAKRMRAFFWAEDPSGIIGAAVLAQTIDSRTDLWIVRTGTRPAPPVIVPAQDRVATDVVDLQPTADGVRLTLCSTACEACFCLPAGRAASPDNRWSLEIRWDDMLADRDADGWTDAFELRLHTRADSADTDGDTIADPLDPAPLGKGPSLTAGCSRSAALVAAFFGYRGFADRASPVFVQGPPAANLQYEGISSPVIYLGREEADSLGFGTVVFEFGRGVVCEPGPQGPCSVRDDPLAAIELSASGDEAEVEVGWYETWLSACSDWVTVRCVRGRWYPIAIRHAGCS